MHIYIYISLSTHGALARHADLDVRTCAAALVRPPNVVYYNIISHNTI